MGRGRKKPDEKDSAATRKPARPLIREQDNAKQETSPTRVSPVAPATSYVANAGTREAVYIVNAGCALSTAVGIIDSGTVAKRGDKPGQVRPAYVIGGVQTLNTWVDRGKLRKGSTHGRR